MGSAFPHRKCARQVRSFHELLHRCHQISSSVETARFDELDGLQGQVQFWRRRLFDECTQIIPILRSAPVVSGEDFQSDEMSHPSDWDDSPRENLERLAVSSDLRFDS